MREREREREIIIIIIIIIMMMMMMMILHNCCCCFIFIYLFIDLYFCYFCDFQNLLSDHVNSIVTDPLWSGDPPVENHCCRGSGMIYCIRPTATGNIIPALMTHRQFSSHTIEQFINIIII